MQNLLQLVFLNVPVVVSVEELERTVDAEGVLDQPVVHRRRNELAVVNFSVFVSVDTFHDLDHVLVCCPDQLFI